MPKILYTLLLNRSVSFISINTPYVSSTSTYSTRESPPSHNGSYFLLQMKLPKWWRCLFVVTYLCMYRHLLVVGRAAIIFTHNSTVTFNSGCFIRRADRSLISSIIFLPQ